MKLLTLLFTLIAAAQGVKFMDLIKEEWIEFMSLHNKNYTDDTEQHYRMKIFMENKHVIAKHNQKFAKNKVSFKLGVNKYADMLSTEFARVMNGFKMNRTLGSPRSCDEHCASFISPANVKLPKTIDWRTKGVVTDVKDQGHCGSCWSFSATGSLEGQHYRKKKHLISLSEQNLIDCSSAYGNNGCNGGMMDNAFRYIKTNGGVDTEKSYPYEGIDDTCKFNRQYVGATDKGFLDIPEGDEKKLMEAVATMGPVSVAIDASHQSFQLYMTGVYYEPECSNETLDHGVLVVGYGTEEDGGDYWLVKNSWGISWGDKGYIKMARNKDNHCGIATVASLPLV